MFDVLKNDSIKRVFSNSVYLIISQCATYISPLLTLGFLIKNLGVEGFGKYALIMTFSAYLQVLVDYGFSYSSCKSIAGAKDKNEIAIIYTSTTLVKICIALIISPIYIILIHLISDDSSLITAASFAVLTAFGSSMFPIWFYQGIQNVKGIAICNVLGRLLSCMLIVALVRTEKDLYIAILAQGFPTLALSTFLNYRIISKFSLRNVVRNDVYSCLNGGWHYFCATFWSTMLANSGVFALNLIGSPSIVGTYAAAERIVKAAISVFSPITQSLYPYNCKMFTMSKLLGLKAWRVSFIVLFFLAILSTVMLIVLADWIVDVMHYPSVTAEIIKLLSVWLFLSVVNNILGIQGLSASGHGKEYSQCFFIATIFTVASLVSLFGLGGDGFRVSICLILGEVVLLVLLWLTFYKKLILKNEC